MPNDNVTVSAIIKHTYTVGVQIEPSGAGTAQADLSTAVEGDTITLTVKPSKDHTLTELKVTDGSGGNVATPKATPPAPRSPKCSKTSSRGGPAPERRIGYQNHPAERNRWVVLVVQTAIPVLRTVWRKPLSASAWVSRTGSIAESTERVNFHSAAAVLR